MVGTKFITQHWVPFQRKMVGREVPVMKPFDNGGSMVNAGNKFNFAECRS